MPVLLRWFFHLLYHQFAWSYDLVASVVSLGRWQEWITAIMPCLTGNRILELGHGPGHLQAALLASGKQVIALDESKQMNRLAYERVKGIGENPRIINGYAQNLPFSNSTFDHVAATFPTEYIFQGPALSEIKRVLAADGTLVVIPAAILTGKSPLTWAIRLLYRITGQAPDAFSQQVIDQITLPFLRAGFDTSVQVESLIDSQILLVTARLPRDFKE